LGPVVILPAGQAAQVRSVVADGVLVTWLPAWQLAHVAHSLRLDSAVKEPVSQAWHSTKLSLRAWVPAGHVQLPEAQTLHAVTKVVLTSSTSQCTTLLSRQMGVSVD